MFEASISPIIVASFVMPFLLAMVLIWFFLNYQKRRHAYETEQKNAQLREKELIIKNQQNIVDERTRIASEMHDELGSGLTLIKYLAESLQTKTNDMALQEDVEKIQKYSHHLVHNMSDIIWAMNHRFDTVESLVSFIRLKASEYLDDNGLPHKIEVNGHDFSAAVGGEKRRYIYLIIKELLHNAVKYSGADSIQIIIDVTDVLTISILEKGGKGFHPESQIEEGNGLYNIQKRVSKIGADIQYHKGDEGMKTILKVPLNEEGMTLKDLLKDNQSSDK
jgi:signal transduction histidine kinase